MEFIIISLFAYFFAAYPPVTQIEVSGLTFIEGDVPTDNQFNLVDLGEARGHSRCVTLELRMVRCPLSHGTRFAADDALLLRDFQHVVAVAIDNHGDIITEQKACLPCPPHCGGKFTSSVPDFLATY